MAITNPDGKGEEIIPIRIDKDQRTHRVLLIEGIETTEINNERTRTTIPENPTATVIQEIDTHTEITHMTGSTVHDRTTECHIAGMIGMTLMVIGVDTNIIEADRTRIPHNHSTHGAECIHTTIHEAMTMAMARMIGDIRCIRCIGVNLHQEDPTTCRLRIVTAVKEGTTIDHRTDIVWEVCRSRTMECRVITAMIWAAP